jgi:4-hydroxybenzoate polyprenyltransferase
MGVVTLTVRARALPTLKDRLSGFISLVRPLFLVLTPVNAAAAAVLALGGYPSLAKCILGFLAVAFASCAVNVFNDYLDRDRDKKIWPDRAIPSGRVRPGEALLVVGVSLAVSLSIAWLVFNPATLVILLLAVVLGCLYSAYLRDRVGYLSLPPVVGLIYLGGWAAFSPETLFGSFLPWYLYLLGVVWQTAHIMVYYPMHTVNKSGVKVPPALFLKPSARAAVITGLIFACLTLLMGILLVMITPLHWLYPIMVTAAGVYAFIMVFRLFKSPVDRKRGVSAFISLTVFRLVISAAILLSVFTGQL